MSNYTKTTDFEAKDSLPSGDSGKIIKGAEFETEFDNIATAIGTKADSAGPTFTGTLTYGTLNDGTTALTSTVAELNILDGVTSTATELNILDGVTSTTAELNILDGVTSTAAELNILDGVTSTTAELNILDGVTATTAELNILDGVTSTAAELNILDGVTSTTAELNILDGVTATTAELNTLDGITAVVGELNALDLGSTAVGTAIASKAVILDSNKDYTGIRNLTLTGDLTVGGDDLVMGTNTAGHLLIADGTNFNPTAVGDLSEISTVAGDDVLLAVDTSGGGLKKVTRSTLVAGLAGSTALSNVVEDTTPQLGGNLDTNSHNILIDDAHFIGDENGNEQIIFQTTSSAVNQFDITNAATGNPPKLSATGGDSNIDLDIEAKGTGHVTIRGNTNAGAIQLNCENNSHGQIIQSQPHSASVTNTMLLPAGSSSTLVSLVSTDTLTNKTLTSPKINEDVAVTATATEINLLDGVTATTAELNILDGVTSTAAELNILDGVTSTAAELNILDGVTSTTAELNILDGVTSTASELNILDGVTATTAEINYLDITTLGTSEASKVVTSDANGVTKFDNGIQEESTAVSSSSNAATLNLRDGSVFTHTLSENVTYTFSNPAASGYASSFTFKITQDSSARTITWPNSVDWAAATAPTISTGSGDVDVFVFMTVDGGTTYYGFTAGQDLS